MTNSGYSQSVYIGNETTFGSAATVNQTIGIVQSISPTETNNFIKLRTLGGTRNYNNIVPGKFEISGSMDLYIQGGAMLRMAMGEDTGSTGGTDSGPKVHSGASYLHIMGSAASPGADSFPSFTLEFADSETDTTRNLKRTYTGCRINSLSLSATVDDPLKSTMDWMASNVIATTAAATGGVAADTRDPYVFYQGAVYATSANVTRYQVLGTSDKIVEVNGFDFTINNNIEALWYIGGTTNAYNSKRGPKALLVKGRDMDGNLDLHFRNKKMYQRFLGAAGATGPQNTLNKYNIVLDFVRSGTLGGVKAATDDYMRLVLASCAFNDINITGAPEDLVAQKVGVFVKAAKIYVVDNDSSYKS